MTVGEYLKSLVWGLEIPDIVIERAACSPTEVSLEPLKVDDDAYPSDADDNFLMRRDYAASTVYYSVLGVFSGGGSSEQVGDVRVSKGSIIVTQADRERFKMLGDMLRRKWGFEVEETITDGEIFDASYLRR